PKNDRKVGRHDSWNIAATGSVHTPLAPGLSIVYIQHLITPPAVFPEPWPPINAGNGDSERTNPSCAPLFRDISTSVTNAPLLHNRPDRDRYRPREGFMRIIGLKARR
ncbi:hypothetical protein LCGC14_2866110, partial [marine sediment metagenome]